MASATSRATRDAFGERLVELGRAEPRLVVLDGDLCGSTRTAAFARAFPDRFIQLGIAEQNMVGVAAGLALAGRIPVAASFACFLAGRLEVIRVAVALNRANVKLVGTHAGVGVGDDGPSQMALEDVAAMRALPGVAVLQPADCPETRHALDWAVAHPGPVYLRLARQDADDVHGPDYSFAFGRLDRVWPAGAASRGDGIPPRQGAPRVPRAWQATVIATGATVANAVRAARDLEPRGFRVQVFNAHTLAPFDGAMAREAAGSSGRIVTVEDHSLNGGLGSAAAEALAEAGAAAPLIRLGLRSFGESGAPGEIYLKFGLSAGHIAEACIRDLQP